MSDIYNNKIKNKGDVNMKLSNVLKLMYSGDKVRIFDKKVSTTVFVGEVKEVTEELQRAEIFQIWSRNNETILFIK